MILPRIVSPDEWLAARKELLAKEKEAARARRARLHHAVSRSDAIRAAGRLAHSERLHLEEAEQITAHNPRGGRMPRPMTEQERQEFLAEPRVGVLSVASDRPSLSVPLWYGYRPGGNLSFFTGRWAAGPGKRGSSRGRAY